MANLSRRRQGVVPVTDVSGQIRADSLHQMGGPRGPAQEGSLEMTETTNGLTGQPVDGATLDDIDDVEAHGLREVAAAAGIGAAVIGAGGVALAAGAGTNPTPGPRTPAIIQQALDDTRQLADDAREGASGLADSARSDANMLAGHTLASAHQLADPTVNQVTGEVNTVTATTVGLAGDVTSLAAGTAGAAAQLATKTAGNTVHVVATTAGAAIDTATDAADSAVNTATTAAANTVHKATTTVDGVRETAITVVGATVDKVNRGWDLSLNVLGDNVSTGGNMLTPSGKVAIKDETGHTLASAKVINGKAKVHLSAFGQNRTLTIHYGGDSNFAASTLHWQVPVGF